MPSLLHLLAGQSVCATVKVTGVSAELMVKVGCGAAAAKASLLRLLWRGDTCCATERQTCVCKAHVGGGRGAAAANGWPAAPAGMN